MNLSYRWLRELAPSLTDSPERISERLGLLGAPVDESIRLGAELGDILIAQVSDVSPHPNADRLRICTVHAGGDAALQVVCGAANVEPGGFYPFAPVGASLPGGVVIRKAKLRGEVSEGMLCSARELGLGRDHAGLLALSGSWAPGASFVDSLGLEDTRLVIDVTANRPDLLSHIGVARELAPEGVAGVRLPPFGDPLPPMTLEPLGASGEIGGVQVSIDDPTGCPRYLAAIVRGVRVGPSPEWLAMRLRAIGQRPISNVVDATNYVLHELGQPLHAFDLARIGSRVRIRRASDGETLRTLDGVDRQLDSGALVIAHDRDPVALAGVMGGEDSEVRVETTDLLLECALFDPGIVRRTARRLGISTDASYRFERGVDPELQPRALQRLVDLIVEVAGGEADGRAIDLRPVGFVRPRVTLRPRRVERLLGVDIGTAEIGALLGPIGFEVGESDATGGLPVTVPGYRPDVTREVDLIEEIARRRGYDSFEERLLPFRPSNAPEDARVKVFRSVHDLFRRWGFLEARTTGFAPAAPDRTALMNPLSSEESHLRNELGTGLLRRVEHNWAHGVRDVRLYEIGTVFLPAGPGELPREELRVGAVATGARNPAHWSEPASAFDRWDLRALFGELAAVLGVGLVTQDAAATTTAILETGEIFGAAEGKAVAGRVRAGALDSPLWAGQVWVLEAALPVALPVGDVHYRAIPEYPAVERDLALIAARDRTAREIEEVIRAAGGDLLVDVRPFDLYEGKGIPEGSRSIAWRLRFRDPERTLTDAEVDAAIDAILGALAERLNVHRR